MKILVEENVLLSSYTTLQVGGVADYFAVVKTVKELEEGLLFAPQTTTPPLILGGGSNVLISDKGYRGLVILNRIKGISSEVKKNDVLVTAAAGENWDDFVAYTANKGWSGLENLSGIPGTVGASPIQNINAYGVSVSDVIESVTVFNSRTKEINELSAEECCFSYRDSTFKKPENTSLIVTAVTFRLKLRGEKNLSYRSSSQSIQKYLTEKSITNPTVSNIREAVLRVRNNIGMLPGQVRSAGSFFKNTIVTNKEFEKIKDKVVKEFLEQDQALSPWYWPSENGVKISTAFLMECSPYNKKSYGEKRKNGIGISPKHSLSIVTEPGATATDVHEFVKEIKKSILEIFGIKIETEVNLIGF